MPNLHELEAAIPVAPLKLIVLDSAARLGNQINNYLVGFRRDIKNIAKNDPAFEGYVSDNYIVDSTCYRFGTGEAKAVISESVRGKDLFILVDVCNHSISYTMNGYTNYKSPDDHYQDLKRVIAAVNGKAHRVNVIMPFLYEGRQHKRSGRESLDCAYAIEELANMGVNNFITFDAHDPRVQNAEPLRGFDNITPPVQFMKALLRAKEDLIIDKDHLIVISPDEGALDRAVYFANVLGVDTGMFYKRRDYSKVVDGRNRIVAHEYMGDPVEGKDIIVADDIIASGDSMLGLLDDLKKRNAGRIFIAATFCFFTNGTQAFEEVYRSGKLAGVMGTNLTYLPDEVRKAPWFIEVDMSKYMAYIIATLNHDHSLDALLNPMGRIVNLLERYNRGEKI